MKIQNPLINDVDLLLKTFAKVLSKPQFVHFEQIIKGILFTELKSINSYSKSSIKHQTSLSRFMNSKAVDENQITKLLIKEIESKLDSNQELDFIFDDTLKRHKYANHIYGLGIHHDHLEGGYSKSHCLVTGGLKQGNYFYPTNCELYQNQDEISDISSFQTKIEIAKAIEKKFEVHVVSVRTINHPGKTKTQFRKSGRFEGKSPKFKKAIVTLKEGETIEVFEQV